MFRAAAFCILLVLSVPASAQPPQNSNLRPLPAQERFTADTTVSATLRLSANRIVVGEAPRFTLLVRNTGTRPIFLNPFAASNLRVFTSAGQPVEAPFGGIADYVGRLVAPSELIALKPGETHEFAVLAEFHPAADFSYLRSYVRLSPGRGARLHLPPGDYSLRFTYINYPDYGASSYDVYEVPRDVWEGRIEAPPVSMTVSPPDDGQVQELIAQIDGSEAATEAIERVQLGRAARAVEPLLRRFQRSKMDRQQIVAAIHDMDAGKGIPRLLALISALPEPERPEVLLSREFAIAARDVPGCEAVPLLLEAIDSTRGDVDSILGESIAQVANKCANLTARLREILRTPVDSSVKDFGRAAWERGNAAQMLGRIGNGVDIPLLIAVLKREIPGIPQPSSLYGDAARQGAVRALGRVGGEPAGQALVEQVTDPVGNRFIMADIVEAITQLRPSGAAQAVSRLLASTDANVLIRAIFSLQRLGGTAVVPQLQALLKHPNPTVRVYASRALLDLGQATSRSEMLSAADDPDRGVQANALFYLARYGDSSSLRRFIEGVVSPQQYIREAAVEGIARFGTAETFVPLRAALDTAPGEVTPYVRQALQRLMFVSVSGREAKPEVDEWWRTHSRLTRLQWAQELLDRTSQAAGQDRVNAGTAILALRYVVDLSNPPIRQVEQAASSRNWSVRAVAAEMIAGSDKGRAASLLLGELNNRQLGACRNAVQQLNKLSDQKGEFDCTRIADRQQAMDRWTNLVR